MEKWRVIAVYRDAYKLSREDKQVVAKLTGGFFSAIEKKRDFPCVGDYVQLNETEMIEGVIERRNILSRKSAGRKHEEQVFASNVDIMFIVTSLNKEFNINKIGRYIILAETNHIKPIVLLTKSDLCDDIEFYINKVNCFYPAAEVKVVSSLKNIGVETIYNMLDNGKGAVFVGASGVGKSTLVNKLIGKDEIKTAEVRVRDDKGKHTTTHRELYELKNGAYVIDTPGIREIGLWINDDELPGYQDIYLLSRACRYRDCSHVNEKECAVKKAVEDGELTRERYNSYIKMSREMYYSKLSQNEGERLRFKSKVKRQSMNERYTKR